MVTYKQVQVRRPAQYGCREELTWVPLPLAKIGNILRIKEGDIWVKGWEVVWCSEMELTVEQMGWLSNDSHEAHQRIKEG